MIFRTCGFVHVQLHRHRGVFHRGRPLRPQALWKTLAPRGGPEAPGRHLVAKIKCALTERVVHRVSAGPFRCPPKPKDNRRDHPPEGHEELGQGQGPGDGQVSSAKAPLTQGVTEDSEDEGDEAADDRLGAPVEQQGTDLVACAELAHEQGHRRDEQHGCGVVGAHHHLRDDLEDCHHQHSRFRGKVERQQGPRGQQAEQGADGAMRAAGHLRGDVRGGQRRDRRHHRPVGVADA